MELDEFLEVIADIQDAGWNVKVVRENEMISDQVPVFQFTYKINKHSYLIRWDNKYFTKIQSCKLRI